MDKKILLGHGSGGKLTHELIRDLFITHFDNEVLASRSDSAVIDLGSQSLSFTTDSFVVDPVFFPGGDIGKLAIAGTVNDLAVSGARPLFLSVSFILEEGFPMSDLGIIVKSMADEAKYAGITIATGDTKVVDRGKCDKIFINTTGIGILDPAKRDIGTGRRVEPGDQILISGTVADHGMSIMAARENLQFSADIQSDCASLNHMIAGVLDVSDNVRFMRDPTRGGVATVIAELVERMKFGIEIDESALPVRENVRGMCEILGFDPLYVANEGKVVLVVAGEDAGKALDAMKAHKFGKDAAIIGEVVRDHPGKAWMTTGIGGKRIIDMLAGEQLPRIC